MDGSELGAQRHGRTPEDPPGWVDGAPTGALGQSCAFCGSRDVVWVHPLARDLVPYELLGRGHTPPSFWTLCDRCEQIHAAGDTASAVEVMRSSDGWEPAGADEAAVGVRTALEVFRRADRTARRLRG